jgi:expansin (peptidoglycan-binding protein)
MLESAWLFVGTVAILSTGVALSTKTEVAGLYGSDDGIAIFSGIVGFLSWGVWSYGALNLELVTNTGEIVTMAIPEVTYFGVAMALIPGYIALTGPAETISSRYRDTEAKDI